MRRVVFSFLCLTLVACQSASRYHGSGLSGQLDPMETPIYRGAVENIITPIIVRHRPFPQSQFSKHTEMRLFENGKEIPETSTIQGYIRSKPRGKDVLQVFEMVDTSLNMKISIEILMSELGEVRDINIFGPDSNIDYSTNKEIKPIVDVLAAAVMRLPKEGMTSGQKLSGLSGGGNLPGLGADFRFSVSSTVRGFTKYKGRNAVVIDQIGTVRMGEIEVPIGGFGLMDTYTGAWIHTEYVIDMTMTVKDKTIAIKGREVGEMQLASGTPFGPAIGEIYAAPSPVPDSPANRSTKTEPSVIPLQERVVPLALIWEGVEGPLLGSLFYTQKSGQGRITITQSDLSLDCSGNWMYSKGSYERQDKPEGVWSVSCTNGRTLSGIYISNKPGSGQGDGKDDQGRKLRFSYGG